MSETIEQLRLVQSYILGQGLVPDLKKAIELFFNAARKNRQLELEIFYPHSDEGIDFFINECRKRVFIKYSEKQEFLTRVEQYHQGILQKNKLDDEQQKKLMHEMQQYYDGLETYEICLMALDIDGSILRSRNSETAYKRALDLAKKGFIPAILFIGRHAYYSKKNRKVIEEVIDVYQKIVIDGDPVIQYLLGFYFLYKVQDPLITLSLILLYQSNNKGNLNARCVLGKMFLFSSDFNIDPFKRKHGLQLLQSAADLNHEHAQRELKRAENEGRLLEVDQKRENEFYEIIKESDCVTALYRLGLSYAEKVRDGDVVLLENAKEALKWYTFAKMALNNYVNPILFLNNPVLRPRIVDYIEVVGAINKLGKKIFVEIPIELILQNEAVFSIANEFMKHCDDSTNRAIFFKIREIHLRLYQMHKENNMLLALEHLRKANVKIEFDPNLYTAPIPKIHAEVSSFFVTYPLFPQPLSNLIVEYSIPSQDEWTFYEGIDALKRQEMDETERGIRSWKI